MATLESAIERIRMNDPQQSIEKARSIVERLKINVSQANWYAALYERIAFKKDIGNAFGLSFEAWGLIKCSEALLDSLIMVVIRIVGGGDENDNAASLNTLLKTLKEPKVFILLEQEHIQHGMKLPCGIEELEKKINALKGNNRFQNLKSYRHAWIAHQATLFDPKRHKMPDYEDAPELLKLIIPIMDLCLALVTGTDSDFDSHASMAIEFSTAQESANDFWKFSAHLKNDLR